MKLDARRTFHQIHGGDGKRFTEQLLEISKHTVSREEAGAWAQNLRFVAVPKEFGTSTAGCKKTAEISIKKEEKTDLAFTDSVDDKSDNARLDCVC